MEFDLAQAILWPYYRTGRHFELSPAVLDMVNERIDREEKQQAGQSAAKGRRASASGAS
jgi:hypothetical protein